MDNGSTCGDSETLDAGKDSESGRRLNPLAVGAAVKRAIDVMDSAISTKPAKLARYDNGIKDDQFQPLEDFYHREMQTDDTHLSTSLGNCRILIPPDMLKLDERHTPLDVEAFLSRVETYDLLMWPNKPDRISAFHCARFGWRIAGSNTLVCVSCHRVEVIPQDPPSCMTLSSWTSKIEHRIQKTGHMSGCIWMKSPSPLNILQLPDGRDMQNYMSRASESFKQMKILPVFTGHYRLVMATADFSGLKSKTNMNLPQKVNGATAEMLEDTASFLMMNGWTMEGAFENTIKCQLCLRQTPLWLCSSTPLKLSNQEIESPSCSPRTKAESNIKEFDPISNHWNWCPWRIKLQSVDRKEKMDEFLTDDETNMYANEGLTVDPRKKPNIDDYLKMAAKIDYDYKSGRLLSGSALQMSNYNKAIETICNVKELLDSAVRSAKHSIISGRRSDCKATNSPNNSTNGIMSIRLSQNFSRKLFDDSDSASLSDSLQRFPDQIFSVENPVDSNSVNEILLHKNEELHIQSVRQVCTAGALESEELESKSCSFENETTVYAKDEQNGDIKADQIIEKPMQQVIPLECLESNAVTPQPKENSSQCGSPTIEINYIEVPDTLVSCPKLTRLHIKSITKAKESTKLEMDQDTSGSVLGKNVKPYKNYKDKENQLSCDSSAQDDITITRPSSDEVESDNQQEKKRVADEISSNFNEGVGCDDCEKSDIIVVNKEIDEFAVPMTIRSKASIIQLDEISSMGDNNDPLCIGEDAVVGQKTQNENIQKRPETFQDTLCTEAETELVSFIENQADAKPQKAFIIENSNKDNENKDDAIGNDAKCTETEVEISDQETHVASCTENHADLVDTDNRKQTIIENRVESLDDKKSVLDEDIPHVAAQSTNNTNTVAPDSQTDEISCIDHKTVERTLDGDEVQSKTEAHTDDVSSHADVHGAEVSDDDDDKEKGGNNSQSEDEKECDNDASNEEDDDADSEPDEESDDEDLRRREEQEDFQEDEYEDEENESEEGLEDEEEEDSEGEEGQAPQVQNGNVDLEKSGDSSDSDVVWLD